MHFNSLVFYKTAIIQKKVGHIDRLLRFFLKVLKAWIPKEVCLLCQYLKGSIKDRVRNDLPLMSFLSTA